MDRDRRVSANRGCDSYVKAILRALRAPAQVEVEPAEPAVAEPAPPDELHLTSSHTDKLIEQLLKRAETPKPDIDMRGYGLVWHDCQMGISSNASRFSPSDELNLRFGGHFRPIVS